MKRTLILLATWFALSVTGTAQVKIFETYADWKNDKVLKTYQSVGFAGHVLGKPYVQFTPVGGGKMENERGFWGFTEGEHLYRLDDEAGKKARIVRLADEGAVCLWVLKAADKMAEGETTLTDFLLYLSVGVNGEIVAMPHGLSSWAGMGIGSYKKFLKENKDTKYRHLCECLEKDRSAQGGASCIKAYNEEHPPKDK